MKQIFHSNINQLNITTGGGLRAEKTRIDTINHPVLVIGLGGTGTDALLRLKYQVNRRFKLPGNQHQKKQKPDNIEFLALETNEHDKKNYKGISLDSHTEMVLLSNPAIGSILNNRSTMPDYIKKWLAPGLTISDGTKGASGNRQAGRLLLFEKINTAVTAIENKIRALRVDQENKLLVFIVSGLSGGTGGGMFLDIAYIVRGLMEREYGSRGIDKVEISGYLFTPDVNLAGSGMNIHTEEYVQRNGYAALKELDYWMNIEERPGDRFCQKYGTRLDVNSLLPPFNLCHLVSATNVDGVLLKNAYDYSMNVTAENIVNFLAVEEKTTGEEFAVQDYYSNLLANISTMKVNLPEEMPHQANFVYNIIGASMAALPVEEINAYLAHGIFREMAPMFDSYPDEFDLSRFVQLTRLDIAQLGESIDDLSQIKLDYMGTDFYSYANVVKTKRVDIDEKLAYLYQNAKRELAKHKPAIEHIKAALNECFVSPNQGPFFTSRLISSDRNPCLLGFIKTCTEELQEKINSITEEIDGLSFFAESKFDEAGKALLMKESKKNAYIEAKVKVYQARFVRDTYTRLIEIYKEIYTELEALNHKTYNVYSEILTGLNKTLDANIEFLCRPIEIDGENHYYWHVINLSDVLPELECVVEKKGYTTLAGEFAKMLLNEAPRFLNETHMDIPGAISDFVYNMFGEFSSRSMAVYLKSKYGEDASIEHIIENEIAPRLYRDAKPVFNLDNAAGTFNFPSYGMVSVPYDAPDILTGIEKYRQHALSGLRFNIRNSKIADRIFWLNTQNGIPLFAYTPIKVYEELYERTITTREGVGRHLVMSETESWVNLPSPIPENLWGDTYTNPRQKELNDEANKLFESGLTFGSIKKQDGVYAVLETEELNLTRYSLDITTEPADVRKALKELTAMYDNGLPILNKRAIFNTPVETEAKAHFIRNVELKNLTKAENAKYRRLQRQMHELQALLNESESEKELLEEFLRTLTCEAIVKRGAAFVYEKELEEDPWPSFVNLIEDADYPEFAIYENYKNLGKHRQGILKQKAKTNEESWQGDRLLVNLKKWQGKIALRKAQLDNDMDKHQNGTALYAFYRNLLLRLNAQVVALG